MNSGWREDRADPDVWTPRSAIEYLRNKSTSSLGLPVGLQGYLIDILQKYDDYQRRVDGLLG